MARMTKAEGRHLTLTRKHVRQGKLRVTVVDFDQLSRELTAQRTAGVTR